MNTAPPEIAKHLRAGEAVFWTGRPRQELFRRADWVWIPIGVAIAVAGWMGLNRSRPIVLGKTTIHPFVFGVVMLIGIYRAAVSPWLDARSRRRMWYAITNLRAIIVDESRRFVASFFLNDALETKLRLKLGGRGTLEFGKLSVAQPKGEWSMVPDRLRTFADIENAGKVDRIILEQRGLHRAFAPQGEQMSMAPFARRANPEGDYAKDAGSETEPRLRYAEPIRAKLKEGEITLFVVRAPAGILFRPMDLFFVPFALVWTTFAIRWEINSLRYVCPAVFGLPFVAVGLYMLVGRFIHDAAERRRTWYTVTNRRCLIVVDGKIIETKSLYWSFIQGVVRQEHGDGRATIYFELSALGRQDTPNQSGFGSMRRPPGVYFERIENSDGIEAIIAANVMAVA